MPQWEVYIVQTESGMLYTGITNDLQRRFKQHQGQVGKKLGAKFFNLSAAATILFREPCQDRAQASRREAAIKQMSRQAKLSLIRTSGATDLAVSPA